MKKILFVNAAFREGSRTRRLADEYLKKQENAEIETVELGRGYEYYLDSERLVRYLRDSANHDFSDPMYDDAKKFVDADEIVIAAPFWNFGIPAVLHMYLEIVCSQGLSFDIDEEGNYVGLPKAQKLTYVTTAGGPIPEEDHAFGYVRQLCEEFWKIPVVTLIQADAIDLVGNDPEEILKNASEVRVI